MNPMNESQYDTTSALTRREKRVLLEALDEFTRSASWGEAKQVVMQRAELLTEATDALLSSLIAKQDDHRAVEILQDHRRILRRCRADGVDTAFAERLVSEGVPPADVDPVVWMRLQTADSYDSLMQLIFDYPELTSFIKRRIAQVLGDAQMDVITALEAYLNADSWALAKVIIEKYPELLSLDADIWLTQYAEFMEAQGSLGLVGILAERRWLLARCRMIGVDAAFADRAAPPDSVPVNISPDMRMHLMAA